MLFKKRDINDSRNLKEIKKLWKEFFIFGFIGRPNGENKKRKNRFSSLPGSQAIMSDGNVAVVISGSPEPFKVIEFVRSEKGESKLFLSV